MTKLTGSACTYTKSWATGDCFSFVTAVARFAPRKQTKKTGGRVYRFHDKKEERRPPAFFMKPVRDCFSFETVNTDPVRYGVVAATPESHDPRF